jgi:hypothetical protein
MSRKFLKVCDGVNLIISPCQYKGFDLKPGMMLFDADTDKRHITGLDTPFVAVSEVSNYVTPSSYGRLYDVADVMGYSLCNDDFKYQMVTARADAYDQIKLLNAVDLALGETRLYNLIFTKDEDRYIKNSSFSACDPNTGFSINYTQLIGNAFLQKSGNLDKDRAVLLTKSYVKALNDMSPYGFVERCKSSLEVEANRDSSDIGSFHDLLYVLYNDYDSRGLTTEEFNDIKNNLRLYYTSLDNVVPRYCTLSDDLPHIVGMDATDDILTACDAFSTLDGFNIKPFMIRLSPDAAKKYLHAVCGSDDMGMLEYKDGFDDLIDDKKHFVYLTSIATYDTNSNWRWQDAFNSLCTNSDNAVYRGFYFDGYGFRSAKFGIKEGTDFDIREHIYRSLDECRYMQFTHMDLSNCKDIDELNAKIYDRLDELHKLVKSKDTFVDSVHEIYPFTEEEHTRFSDVYVSFSVAQRDKLNIFNKYAKEQLTDKELHATPVDLFNLPEVKEYDDSLDRECDE